MEKAQFFLIAKRNDRHNGQLDSSHKSLERKEELTFHIVEPTSIFAFSRKICRQLLPISAENF